MLRKTLTVFCVLSIIANFLQAQSPDGERAWFLLDRVYRNYPKDTATKKKPNTTELFDELKKDVEEASALLKTTSDKSSKADLQEVLLAIKSKSSKSAVSKKLSDLKNYVITAFKLQTFPSAGPDYAASGEQFYNDTCANCHNGATKVASKALIQKMLRKPPDFRKAEYLENLSPYTAYQALSHATKDNVMPNFTALAPELKWSLATYIFSLAPQDQEGDVTLTTKLNWQTQMIKSNAELLEEHAKVNPWQLRKALISQAPASEENPKPKSKSK